MFTPRVCGTVVKRMLAIINVVQSAGVRCYRILWMLLLINIATEGRTPEGVLHDGLRAGANAGVRVARWIACYSENAGERVARWIAC